MAKAGNFSEIVITSLKVGADFKKERTKLTPTFKLGIGTKIEKKGSFMPAKKKRTLHEPQYEMLIKKD